MSYVKSNWSEAIHTEATILANLDNLEGMYDEIIDYIDNYLHSTIYHNKTYCDSNYFGKTTDGHNSNLVCKTLDGYTVEQLIALGQPANTIMAWTKSIELIPSGFALCNGQNGTPDLRNKFIMSNGTVYDINSTGGANTITTTATVVVGNHALTAAETPKHEHTGIGDSYPSYSPDTGPIGSGNNPYVNTVGNVVENTGYAGSGTTHTHDGTFTGTANQILLPPYCALCFIMRL